MIEKDIAIIGAGAAGLMCALHAAKKGKSVVLIDHQDKPGKKIRISGGGRCNFTNLYSSPENFISENKHFCKSALARYTPFHFIEMVENNKIAYHEREEGQLFCDDSAQQITDLFVEELNSLDCTFFLSTSVKGIKAGSPFLTETTKGLFKSEQLIIATGGLSIPKMGATGFGHKIAGEFGLKVTELAPALVPFTYNPLHKEKLSDLSGISVPAKVSCADMQFNNKILFTHRGLSGPAILQISSYWNSGETVVIDLLSDNSIANIVARHALSKSRTDLILGHVLPKRLAKSWSELEFPAQFYQQLSPKEKDALEQRIHNWRIVPGGTEGYRTAEVTRGGVNCDELSSKTMESKKVPGLFFIGEVVDVTGHLGGHNFQWAWASGYAAGVEIGRGC